MAYIILDPDGLIVPVLDADPSSPQNGTIWYRSDLGKFRGRENGVSKDLISVGGGASSVPTEIELDFGYPATFEKEFLIPLIGLISSDIVQVWQSSNIPTGKDEDYMADDPLLLISKAEDDGLRIIAKTMSGEKYGGAFKLFYKIN